jgi:hypothetical protein
MTLTPQEKPTTFKKSFDRFDLIILAVILSLSLALALVLWGGDRTTLQVIDFSWQDRIIGVKDRWFSLTFNRPVNRESVENNLVIEPTLPGKISGRERSLVYTLTQLPIYGYNYRISMVRAKKLTDDTDSETFVGRFKSRDRAFVYIGTDTKERGQLFLVNNTQKTKTVLTPHDLIVTHFEIYPDGDKILFSAFERGNWSKGVDSQQLYTVTSGLNFQSLNKQLPGRIQRILDSKNYQNLRFDLSENGKTIVVSRVNRNNPGDASLWVLPEGERPRPLGISASNFTIAPDGNTVAVLQRGGIATIPLSQAGSSKFLAGYESIIGFSRDGSQQLLVKNNADYTRSLVLVDNRGATKELFTSLSPIINCQLEPREEKILYCLRIGLVERGQQQYLEEAYLAAIDLETTKEVPIIVLPNYQNLQMSMSADGAALLFDQIVTGLPNAKADLKTDRKEAIVNSRLWLLTLPELTAIQEKTEPPKVLPEELNFGYQPRWIP